MIAALLRTDDALLFSRCHVPSISAFGWLSIAENETMTCVMREVHDPFKSDDFYFRAASASLT